MERWVSWAGVDINNDPEYGYSIKLKYRLWAFIDDVSIPIAPGAMYVNLLADNSICVDSTGVIEPCDTEGAIGEFNFYMALFNQSIVMEDLVVAKIQWADSEGKFNTF